MFRKSCFALTIAGLLIASGTIAAQTYVKLEQRFTAEQLRETGLDTLSPEQLEKLNQLLSTEPEKTSSMESPRVQDETRQAFYIGLDDKPIKSRLKGSISGWDVDTVFELENGQKWKVLKGNMKMRQPMQAPDIVVVPGIAGRWFLQVDEDLPKARVYRID
jgi:acetyl/propionyl-CoA carboxylase alpha subunit